MPIPDMVDEVLQRLTAVVLPQRFSSFVVATEAIHKCRMLAIMISGLLTFITQAAYCIFFCF